MAHSGFLIRFIDIGLIVLFGFVTISEIETSSPVELSAAADAENTEAEILDRVFLTVQITPNGAFTVADTQSDELLAVELAQVGELSRVLARLKELALARGQEPIVLITPHEDSLLQWTVDVMDVCDLLGLGKSLQTGVALDRRGQEA